MSKELAKTYDPKGLEDRLYQKWLDKGYFHATVNPNKKPFTIMMPPPNVTGQLHMGHALDNTMQDILCRFKRMEGYEVLFLITFSFSVGIETAFIIIAFFYFVKPPRAKTFLLMEVLRFHALIFGESAMHSTAFLRGRTTRSGPVLSKTASHCLAVPGFRRGSPDPQGR